MTYVSTCVFQCSSQSRHLCMTDLLGCQEFRKASNIKNAEDTTDRAILEMPSE